MLWPWRILKNSANWGASKTRPCDPKQKQRWTDVVTSMQCLFPGRTSRTALGLGIYTADILRSGQLSKNFEQTAPDPFTHNCKLKNAIPVTERSVEL